MKTGSLSLGQFGEEYGPMIKALDDWIVPALEGVSMVFYEEPINSKFQSLVSRRKLYCLGPHIEWRCFLAGIRVREIGNTSTKKLCYGRGNITSKEKEAEAVPLAKKWGFDPANHDEADACAVFLAGVNLWFPEDFRTWSDRRTALSLSGGQLLI